VTDATITYADAGDIGAVRAFVSARAAALGLRPERVELLALAVSELVTNTLQHTRGGGHVRLWTAGGQLVADVVDNAPAGTRAEQRSAMPPAEAIRGRGLAIVEQICDAVELSAARVRVRFTL
jgi:serine/threonine-protein kinase RsbW